MEDYFNHSFFYQQLDKIIDTNKSIYLIMDLCLFNLEEYINMRKEKLSIDEIKKIY